MKSLVVDKMSAMNSRKNEQGVIMLAFLFFIVLLLLGFVVVRSISKSSEAEQVRETTGDVIESAQDAADTFNDAQDTVREQAGDLINHSSLLYNLS